MSLFKSAEIPVKRPSAGDYINGRWKEGANPEYFTVFGSIQPDSGETVQSLLEGKRVSSIYRIFTDVKLQEADPLNKVTGDIVKINGQDYEVIQVQSWQNGLIPHYESVVIREKEGT
jgi:hypothetical protein